MAGVNKVILVGHLGKDPEVRYTPDGRPVCNFSMATTETWKDKTSGERKSKTEWHRIVIFGPVAEIAGQYLSTGKQVYIEGKLQTRKWKDQNTNTDRYTTEVVVDMRGTMQMLGSRQDNQQNGGYQQPQQGGGGFQQNNPQQSGGGQMNHPSPGPGYNNQDDDIPF